MELAFTLTSGPCSEYRLPTASGRRWKLIFFRRKGTISALEALRDAPYKAITATTITTATILVSYCPHLLLQISLPGVSIPV